jgi:hypothetical protein
MRAARQTTRRALRPVLFLTVCALLAVVAAPARALAPEDEELDAIESAVPADPHARTRVSDTHDPNRAAHPVRIAAYALHPVGVALDWMLVRPAVWVAKREPFRTIFGYED